MFGKSLVFAIFIIAVGVPALAENAANAYLLAQTPKEQAHALGKVAGDGCKGKTAYYMGSMDEIKHEEPKPGDLPPLSGHAHDAFWSLRCKDGRSFEVSVFPDGKSGVLDCATLETMNAGHCFKKMTNR